MTKIGDIKDETKSAGVIVKVVAIKEKEYESERGKGTYFYGIIGDETGTLPFTAWVLPSTVRVGDVVELKNCSVRKYNERLRLYVDSRSEVILRPEDVMEVKRTYRDYKVRSLNLNDSYVSVTGLITQVSRSTYKKDGIQKEVISGQFTDDTGTVRISSFGPELKDGMKVQISGARVQEYRGRLRLSINENSAIAGADFPTPEVPLYRISEVDRGISGIEVTGICVAVGDRSGLTMRCSQCRRRVDDGSCEEHPDAEKTLDLYATFTLEDGTASIQCNTGKDVTSTLTGISVDGKEFNQVEIESVHSGIKNKLLGRPFLVRGEASVTDQGTSLRAESIVEIDVEALKRIRAAMRMGID